MKEQFTPAPWLNAGTTVYALQDSVRLGKTTKINRFQFFIQGRCSGEEVLANAILAKAAPKMYHKLGELVWFLENMHECDTDWAIKESSNLHKEVDQLLAEARGEKSDTA